MAKPYNRRTIIYWLKFVLLWSYLVMFVYWLLITNGDIMSSLINPLFFYYNLFNYTIEIFKSVNTFLALKISLMDTISKEVVFIIACYLFLVTFIFLYLFFLNQDDFDLGLNILLKKYPWLPKFERMSWYIILAYIFFLFIKNSF